MPIDEDLFAQMDRAMSDKKPTDEELLQQQMHLQSNSQAQQQSGLIDSLTQFGKTYVAEPAKALGYGALQGASDIGSSVGNIIGTPLSAITGQNYEFGRANYRSKVNPNYSSLFMVGQVIPELMAFSKLSKVATPLTKGISGLQRLGAEAIKDANIGAAINEHGFGGREGGAAMGALFSPFGLSTDAAIAKTIGQDLKAGKAKISPLYDDLLSKAGHVPTLRYSDAMHDLITEKLLTKKGDAYIPFMDYLKNPSIRSAKDAISGLKAEQRAMLSTAKVQKSSGLGALEGRKYDLITDLISDVEKQIDKGFKTGKYPSGLQELKSLDELYAKQVGPYEIPYLESFMNKGGRGKRASASKVTEEIHKMKDTSRDQYEFLMKKYPQLYLNKHKNKIMGGGVGVGAALGFGPSVLDKLSEILGARGQE